MKDRLNQAFPALLLVCVALVQVVRARTHDQTSWKGGGFGMFATADSPGARFVRTILVGAGENRVALPSSLSRDAVLAKTVPTEENIRTVARKAADISWVREDYEDLQVAGGAVATGSGDGVGRPALPGESPDSTDATKIDPSLIGYRALEPSEPEPPPQLLLEVKAVRVEVWRVELNPRTLVMKASLIRAVTVTR